MRNHYCELFTQTINSNFHARVERVTTNVSYLRKRLTLIFARKIQADKSSFLKITSCYKSTLSGLFYRSTYIVL